MMALQNNYKAVIDYTQDRSVYAGVTVVGRARDFKEVVRRIQEKFASGLTNNVKIWSIEYLGWETF